ncbi:ornithine carbamoyltransferase [Rhizobium sp. C4]|uniref:ornithine carbamoyltransferase n=1 Tax=Rhizobium sp. C4 TaxID=1349800 RepID=UPI001E4F98A7|nr:ornithine carbamoyltransferase [Rhizobium sp. C4]MCD2173011.1 ornithine carbamoyltransferase [Rhizobium sp. C4]
MKPQSNRDFLEFHALPTHVVMHLLERADELGTHWENRTMPQTLIGQRVGLIVDDTGWRNTTAFELGVKAMGGIIVQPPISLNSGEVTSDLAGYLDNWFDLLIVRTRQLATLKQLADAMRTPIINARTRTNHPCETLGDLAFVRKMRGSIEGLKVVGLAPEANILSSWVEASRAMPIEVVQVYPAHWHVNDFALLNPNFTTSQDMLHVLDADVIFTDSWPVGADHAELLPYQVTQSLLDQCKSDALFLPCPPVARGQEVSSEAMEHHLCKSRSAKAFLLHAQNALMEWAIGL